MTAQLRWPWARSAAAGARRLSGSDDDEDDAPPNGAAGQDDRRPRAVAPLRVGSVALTFLSGRSDPSLVGAPAKTTPAPWVLRVSERIDPRVHYGHVIVVVASLVLFFTAAGTTYGIGVFAEAMMADLGISRTAVSGAWTFALLATGVLMPVSGRMIDRFGPRAVMAALVLPYSLSLLWIAYVTDAVSLTFALFFLRWAMSTAMITAYNATNQWWVRRKGLATAVVNVVGALNITFPTMQAAIAAAVGWRATLLIEAAMMGAIFADLAALTLNRPETYGRLPDGRSPSAPEPEPDAASEVAAGTDDRSSGSGGDGCGDGAHDKLELAPLAATPAPLADDAGAPTTTPATAATATAAPPAAADEERHWHWRDAVRTRAFWGVALSACMTGLLWSGVNFHFFSIMVDMGLDAGTLAYLYVPIAISSAAGMLVAGYLVDRVRVKSRATALATLAGLLSTGLVFVAGTPVLAVLFALVFGFMDGVQAIGNASVFAYLFGRVHLGRIDSIVNGLYTVFLGLGPSLFGVVRDATGSYTPMLIACAAPLFLLTVLLVLTPAPNPPRHGRYLGLDEGA